MTRAKRPRRPHTGTRGGHRRYRLTGPHVVSGVAIEAHARDLRRETDRSDEDDAITFAWVECPHCARWTPERVCLWCRRFVP